MKRLLCILLVFMMVLLNAPANAGAENIDDQVDKYFKQGHTVGGSVVIAWKGEIVYERDYGFANKKRQLPITADTYFKIASVTKMISAIGMMQLVEQGKINLDQDISEYFGYKIANPYYPRIPITLRQCMSHTTALNEHGGYTFESRTVHDLLAAELKRKSNFMNIKPGSAYGYSNFGAGLMGSVMEAVTGESINAYMAQNVFMPLGIDAAYSASMLKSPGDVSAQHQSGRVVRAGSFYVKEKYEDFPDPERHYRITVGSLFIRARDAARLAIALCGDGSCEGVRLLSSDSVALMRMNQYELGASVTGDSPYGLCVNLVDNLVDGKRVYGHQGMTDNAMCDIFFDPDTQFVFVMLTNGCDLHRDDRIGILPRKLFEYLYPIFTAV